jgi:biopolymer transport protein ExbB
MESYLVMREKHCQDSFGVQPTRIAMLTVAAAVVTIFAASAWAGEPADALSPDSNTKTFFHQFVVAGGPIVWVILLPMSVITGYLAIDLCSSIRRRKLLPPGIGTRIATTARKLGTSQLGGKLSPATDLVSRAVLDAVIRSKHLGSDQKDLQHLAAQALQERGLGLLRKVEWCNVIGNVAPMVGLFGTVFGMIKAFNLLGISGGQPRPDQLAAAISIALITTFWGLLIAIPALAMGGIFRARAEGLVGEAAIELETLLRQITLTGAAQAQPATKPAAQTQPVPKQTVQSQSAKKQPARAQPIQSVNGRQRYQAKPVKQPTRDQKRRFPIKPVS